MTVQDLIQMCEDEQLEPDQVQLRLAFFDRSVGLTTCEGSEVQYMGYDPDKTIMVVPDYVEGIEHNPNRYG